MEPEEPDDRNRNQSSYRAQLTRLILKLQREDEGLIGPQADKDPLPVIDIADTQNTNSGRAIACSTLFLGFILLSFFLLTWMGRDSRPAEIPSWQPVFSFAEIAREEGELSNAKELYSQAGTFAASRDDWAGLLAAACGLNRLKQKTSAYSAIEAILLRAMTAAEKTRSRRGLIAIAKVFTLLGNDRSAAVALSRVENTWPTENSETADVVSSECWKNPADSND